MRTVAQSETVGPLDQLAQRWARSGAMSLTGRSDGAALGCRSGVVEVLELASTQLVENSQRIGTEVAVDGLALLCERAAITGLSRRGSTSCGGATRLLQTADGYLALSLARPEDIDLLPALLGDSFASLRSEGSAGSAGSAGSIGSAEDQVWSQIEGVVRNNRSQELEALGVELGLAIARLPLSAAATGWVRSDDYVSITDPTHPPDPDDSVSSRVRNAVLHAKLSTDRFAPSSEPDRPIRVVDLSSLWAGPLCGQLLSAAGCDVIKVESVSRPDGARMGSPEFFDLLNGTKRSVSLDFANREDIRALIDLLASADVVIEASRPRALEQLGIDRDAILATSGISVWLQNHRPWRLRTRCQPNWIR